MTDPQRPKHTPTTDQCAAAINVRHTPRRCEQPAGHDGYHVTNDTQGRPEYFWAGSNR
jgi:hypothetical protein